MKVGLVLTLRVLLLFVVTMGCFMVAGAVSSLAGGSGASDPAARVDSASVGASILSALLLMCGFVTLVVSGIVLRARASGWQLAGALSLATFGVMTFLYYIEAQVFLRTRMSPENMKGMLAMGGVFAVLLGPLAVWILGRWGRPSAAVSQPVAIPARAWLWMLTAIGVCYVALYMIFGYFVAWQNPALRDYYGGTDPGSFVASHASELGHDSLDLPATVRPRDPLGPVSCSVDSKVRAQPGRDRTRDGAVFCCLVPAAPLPQSVHAGRNPLESSPRDPRIQPDLRLRRGLVVEPSGRDREANADSQL